MLAVLMDLCEMCRRLLLIVKAQQVELERRATNEQALSQWKRETEHIEDQLRQIES